MFQLNVGHKKLLIPRPKFGPGNEASFTVITSRSIFGHAHACVDCTNKIVALAKYLHWLLISYANSKNVVLVRKTFFGKLVYSMVLSLM